MNKKVIIGIIIVLICIAIGCILFFTLNNNNQESQNQTANINEENSSAEVNESPAEATGTNETETNETPETNTETETGKTLVVYFSAQNHTEAEKIAQNLNADIFEITPEEEYTTDDLNWNDENSRVSREYEDESLRDIALVSTTVENWDSYDTVIIGYPIWWGIAAWPVDTFVEANDFTGKTVIPFCTSSSSGLGQSGELVAEKANGGEWLEGHRFNSNPSDSAITEWTDSLKQ